MAIAAAEDDGEDCRERLRQVTMAAAEDDDEDYPERHPQMPLFFVPIPLNPVPATAYASSSTSSTYVNWPRIGDPRAHALDSTLLQLCIDKDFMANYRKNGLVIAKDLLAAHPFLGTAPSVAALRARFEKLIEPHKNGATYSVEIVSTGNEPEGEGADDLVRETRMAAEYVARKLLLASETTEKRRVLEMQDAAAKKQEADYSMACLDDFEEHNGRFECTPGDDATSQGTCVHVFNVHWDFHYMAIFLRKEQQEAPLRKRAARLLQQAQPRFTSAGIVVRHSSIRRPEVSRAGHC